MGVLPAPAPLCDAVSGRIYHVQPPQPMALEVGSRLAHYDVTALIGEGGMGEVYRARDTKLDRDVALKVLPQAFTG